MNKQTFELAGLLVGSTYASQAEDARKRREKKIRILLDQRKWPEIGWSDRMIELLLQELADMDSNNFIGNVGAGERESRIAASIVARRHFGFGHGVGRSGDISAIQPKAAGSSVLARVAESMTMDLIKLCGVTRATSCLILPVATGMAIVMALLSLRSLRPQAKYVVWSRVDQKSCFKAIVSAGYIPIVVPNKLAGDEVVCDLDALTRAVRSCGSGDGTDVLCIITTTSIFAPRAPDDVVGVARLCKDMDIPHITNNAYGLQISKITHQLNEAIRVGRLDIFVQSSDKNLLVPVGGSILASGSKDPIDRISKLYPGRASGSPVLDVFITLLTLGSTGYKALLTKRKECFMQLRVKLEKVANKHGERVLVTKSNNISIGLSLESIATAAADAADGSQCSDIQFLGSMLFQRCVSGTRVVNGVDIKTVAGTTFHGYGAHIDNYPTPYLTAAAAIGMELEEVDVFVDRLDKALTEFKKKAKSSRPPASAEHGDTSCAGTK
eukprot:m.202481 g.202481  ORF g.202481 m.202481 type:complete len:497 (+) comp18833_c0_seq1:206-1696(+)